MCGIAGLLSAGKPFRHPSVLKHMCDSIAHRGPDDAGYSFFHDRKHTRFADEAFRSLHAGSGLRTLSDKQGNYRPVPAWYAGLGHRRLSILDLTTAGHQPMATQNEEAWITYNGEIYNFPELRLELESSGYHFRSRSDTEVLLELYRREGISFVARLNGMFAFAIWDTANQRLFCARDRYGIKPFYFSHRGDRFAFCSEIKGILASGMIDPAMNQDALNQYLSFQNIFDDQTLFAGIEQLPPAHTLEVQKLEGSLRLRFRRYWDFDPAAGLSVQNYDRKLCSDFLCDTFEGAVKRQLLADVTVGSYLSGGLDSSAITAQASKMIKRLYTFTAGFNMADVTGIEQGFDEREQAVEAATRFGTEHYECVLHSGDMQACLETLIWHLEDLRAGICYQNFYAAKLASNFVSVCLAGTGGDEIFAGYPWRYQPAFSAASVAEFDAAYFSYWQRLLTREGRQQLFSSDLWSSLRLKNTRPAFDAVLEAAPRSVPADVPLRDFLLRRALYFESKTFLRALLTVEDRISMAHSLEVRVPFLDNSLVDLAQSLPVNKLMAPISSSTLFSDSSYREYTEGKAMIRNAFRKFLPDSIVTRNKQGFSTPEGSWYRGPSMDTIKEILLDPLCLARPWFRPEAVQQILLEHFEGQCNHRLLIWSLLSLEVLQRLFFKAPGPAFKDSATEVITDESH